MSPFLKVGLCTWIFRLILSVKMDQSFLVFLIVISTSFFNFFFNCVCFPFHLPLSDNNLQQQQKASRMSGRIFLIPKDVNILLIV